MASPTPLPTLTPPPSPTPLPTPQDPQLLGAYLHEQGNQGSAYQTEIMDQFEVYRQQSQDQGREFSDALRRQGSEYADDSQLQADDFSNAMQAYRDDYAGWLEPRQKAISSAEALLTTLYDNYGGALVGTVTRRWGILVANMIFFSGVILFFQKRKDIV